MGWETIVIPFAIQVVTFILKVIFQKTAHQPPPDWSVPLTAAGVGTTIGVVSDSLEWWVGTLCGMAAVWLTETYRRLRVAIKRRRSGSTSAVRA